MADGGSTTKYDPLAPGGPIWFGLGVNSETLSGAKTLYAYDEQHQILDPGGADRTVTLPGEGKAGARTGMAFFIKCADAATPGETLTVQSDAPATVATLEAGDSCLVVLDGSGSWQLSQLVRKLDVGTYKAQVTVSSAQVLALHTTPVSLVAAPGAGKFLEFVSAHLWLDHETADYAAIATGDDLVVSYTDASGEEVARVEATGFLDASADAHALALAQSAALDSATAILPVANAALVLHLTGAVTTGDSPLKVETLYRVRDLTW